MISTDYNSSRTSSKPIALRSGERGAALATAILMLGLLSAIAMTVLAVVSTESKVAGGDLQRTQAFYAAASGIEKMSSDFNALFARTSRPSQTQLNTIANSPPDLASEGFTFNQTIQKDEATLATMRATQNILTTGNPPVGANPTVTVPNGPLVGLTASVVPYILNTTATSATSQVNIERRMNNYLVPIFQFGMFSDTDMEIHPGPQFTFNGRVHANGNLYVNGNVTFLDKVTTASEVVRDVMRNHNPPNGNATHTGTVTFNSGPLAVGASSVVLGPNTTEHPDVTSPAGTINPAWKTNSVANFAGQLLTGSTGVAPLKLPLQLDGNQTREIIKRRTPNDDVTLSDSRYHTKAEIRILLDDEGVTTDVARSNADPLNGNGTNNAGVNLSTFNPIVLPNVFCKVSDAGVTDCTTVIQQQQNGGTAANVDTVRSAKAGPTRIAITNATNVGGVNIIITTATAHGFGAATTTLPVFISDVVGQTRANGGWTATIIDATHFSINRNGSSGFNYVSGGTVYSYAAVPKSSNTVAIPGGAGIAGHILVQIVDANGVARDVTTQILSMGMTEGEPNAIVTLQRPLWAAYLQGTRDATLLGTMTLKNSIDNLWGADGQFGTDLVQNTTAGYGFITSRGTDNALRQDNPYVLDPSNFTANMWNSIVPINLYNVREGRINSNLAGNTIYERGMTSIVEINMKNLARWVDGAYDANVLAGTTALSTNIGSPDGWIVYVSDRRGDKINDEVDTSNATVTMTNGMCDNEDIYGPLGVPNGALDAGEDVIDFKLKKGTLQKDVTELPDPANLVVKTDGTTAVTSTPGFPERLLRANQVSNWSNIDQADTATPKTRSKYFRRAVRLFNGENLQTSMAGTGKLSTTKGITVASENMVYIWGNYNTTGINQAPAAGTSSLNDATALSHYCPGAGPLLATACASTTDRQVPTSVVCDAYFQLSKTWFDGESALYPDDVSSRPADRALAGVITEETSVRVGIIAGNNLSALSATATGLADAGNYSATANDNESRLCGGMHNFPRFLETWPNRFNFAGSLIPLYKSTQAMGQYSTAAQIYGAPLRNWAFDVTFRQSDRLPPGTPQFQYIEPTAFRQVLY